MIFDVVCDSTFLNSVAARLGFAAIILLSTRELSHKINALLCERTYLIAICIFFFFFCPYMVDYFNMVRGDANELLI